MNFLSTLNDFWPFSPALFRSTCSCCVCRELHQQPFTIDVSQWSYQWASQNWEKSVLLRLLLDLLSGCWLLPHGCDLSAVHTNWNEKLYRCNKTKRAKCSNQPPSQQTSCSLENINSSLSPWKEKKAHFSLPPNETSAEYFCYWKVHFTYTGFIYSFMYLF